MHISPPRGAAVSYCVRENGWHVVFTTAAQAREYISRYPGTVLAVAAALVLPRFQSEWFRTQTETAWKEIHKTYREWEKGKGLCDEKEKL